MSRISLSLSLSLSLWASFLRYVISLDAQFTRPREGLSAADLRKPILPRMNNVLVFTSPAREPSNQIRLKPWPRC